MPERIGSELRLHVEATSTEVGALVGYRPFAAARLIASGGGSDDGKSVALVRGAHQPGSEIRAAAADCVVVRGNVEASQAILIPPLASALALWETLDLELGDAAVWTAGAPLSGLVGQVALWRGACPAIALGNADGTEPPDARQVEYIEASDQEAASARLVAAIASRPGFAAVDLSGRAEVIDVLLEAIPRWGRLQLAGPQGAPVTIDFYKNVHRKGIALSATTLEPVSIFEGNCGGVGAQTRRAATILANPKMAARCAELLRHGTPFARLESLARA